jgi:RNA recognition motif-containing protein
MAVNCSLAVFSPRPGGRVFAGRHGQSVTVATDRDTGRSRGFGFVEMASAGEANAAIARLNGTDLDGRQIRVEMSSSTGRTGAPPRRSGGGGGGGGRGRW